jgi:dihydrodipicolinate synthase/N-acetylneuraminate lyase
MTTTKRKITGLLPVAPTPLTEDESLDEAGMEKMSAYIVEWGFDGVWALASAGEDQNLPRPLIEAATRRLVHYLGGRMPVLVKSSAPGVKDTLEWTRRLSGYGIDAAIIHCEHHKLTPDHVRRYYLSIAEASPVPIYIYQNASRGAEAHVNVLLELAQHPNIHGMKAAGSDLGELQTMSLLAPDDFGVFTAGGGQIMAGLAIGASGHTAMPIMMFPKLSKAIYAAVRDGRLDDARRDQRRIITFLRALPKLGNREICAETKAVLAHRGIMQRHVSAPFRTATEEQAGQIIRLLEEHGIE